MTKVVIIHFQPIELYPPVLNLLNYLQESGNNTTRFHVLTLHPPQAAEKYTAGSSSIRIHRAGSVSSASASAKRYLGYLVFYFSAIYQLLTIRPVRVLSFETLSFLPVYIYKSFFFSRTEVLVHYHEYTSPDEYRNGMTLSKWMHEMEKKMYPEMKWVSHTNELRMEKFIQDHNGIRIPGMHILPNYPPYQWKTSAFAGKSARDGIVYVGALGLETMYIREFASWVLSQNGKVVWDIYSNNAEEQALHYLLSLDPKIIRFKGAVNYYQLPSVLSRYRAGVVLYNGHIQNYILNAPNKLFEYLACDLDVCFPNVMTGATPYITTDTYPKVIAVDFKKMESFTLESLFNREGLSYKPSVYFAEAVLPKLAEQLTSSNK
jgi:hypothetical protein